MKSNPTMRVVLTLRSKIKITVIVACVLLGGVVLAEQFGANPRPVKAAGNQDRAQQKTTPRKESTPVAAPTLEAANIEAQNSSLLDDCSYLKKPESFSEALAQHRTEISDLTTQLRARIELNPNVQLMNPRDAQRKNYIDTILFDRMVKDSVMSAPICTDEEFVRRVYLDLTGRIPAPEAVTAFLADTSANRRDNLVDFLIGNSDYVDKWTMFFGDLLRNNANNQNITRYVEGRDAFYNYIQNSIITNKSYAQMAREMITASGDSFVNGAANFTVGGHISGGPAQDIYDGLAVQASTIFLGLSSTDCLMCHSGAGHLDAVNLWGAQRSREEAWGMAAFFARSAKARVDAETPAANRYFKYMVSETATGEYNLNTTSGNRQARQPINGRTNVAPKYILAAGAVNTGERRCDAIARLITSDKQFARATVNYIWEKMMVEALVSPSDSFDPARLDPNAQLPNGWTLQPANAELLEALAQDFISSNYNLQALISRIAKSSAYQLSSQYPGDWGLTMVPYYARKFARRMDAEEMHDAVVAATGIIPSYQMRDSTGANTRVINRAMQFPDTTSGGSDFINSFLRGDRDTIQRSQDGTLLQALNLMNNSFVMGKIHQANAGSTVSKIMANTTLTTEAVINQLYLTTLSRKPTTDEVNTLIPMFTSLGRKEATESLQWVLLNKVDFIYNY